MSKKLEGKVAVKADVANPVGIKGSLPKRRSGSAGSTSW